jgi:thiamine biosynthesis protein ThiI
VLLYRRYMYRIAAALARRTGASALCTGENLGQVASQTLENLGVVDKVTPLLTLRPLVCFDKREIITIARSLGTYDTSILPFDDCCTLFVPRNPALRASVRSLEKAELALDIDALVAESVERTEVVAC